MLSQQLLRAPFYGSPVELEMAEAFAYCYAATFSGGEIPARMTESYLRAWDHDSWDFVPTSLAGRPGYVKAYFLGVYRPKVIVAFRGMTSFASLLPVRGGYAASIVPANEVRDFEGHVFDLFKSYAATALAELEADEVFANKLSITEPYPIVVTGFSMGAAVAEILAAKLRVIYPRNPVKLIKFASPRIGSEEWLANEEVARPKLSVYLQDDPVQAIPFTTARVPTFASPNFVCPFAPDPNKLVYWLDGKPSVNSVQNFPLFVRQTMQIPLGLPAYGSAWWMHRWETYRYAMCNVAKRAGENVHHRLRHLEYPNDNIWGRDFRSLTDWAPLVGFENPAPADFDADFEPAELRRVEEIRTREAELELGLGGGGDYGLEGGEGGGGDYDMDAGAGGGGDYSDPSEPGDPQFNPPVSSTVLTAPSPIHVIRQRTRTRRAVAMVPLPLP